MKNRPSGCIDLTTAISRKPFYIKPESRKGLWSVLLISNLLWISALAMVGRTLWKNMDANRELVKNYLVEFSSFLNESQLREKSILEENRRLASLVQLEQTSAGDTMELADRVARILDTTQNPQRREFLAAALEQSIRIQGKYKIPGSAVVAMALYESRYGQSKLAKLAHNYHGLKAFGGYQGPVVWMQTKDFDKTVDHSQPFRKYENLEKGFIGYADFLTKGQRYDQAFKFEDGPSFVRAIAKAGYCPDGDYTKQVIQFIEKHKLGELDELFRERFRIQEEVTKVGAVHPEPERLD